MLRSLCFKFNDDGDDDAAGAPLGPRDAQNRS